MSASAKIYEWMSANASFSDGIPEIVGVSSEASGLRGLQCLQECQRGPARLPALVLGPRANAMVFGAMVFGDVAPREALRG